MKPHRVEAMRTAKGRPAYAAIRRALDGIPLDTGAIFPWRKAADPWATFLAEVLLQRTSRHHVVRAYGTLLEAAPDPESLVALPPHQLSELLRPLGMPSRLARLREAARSLAEDYQGHVPSSRVALLNLPGVGPYTANAIACFAFGQRHPLVDTGTARMHARLFAIPSRGRARDNKAVWDAARRLLGRSEPRRHNLAVLTAAQEYCTGRPKCETCPLRLHCSFAAPAQLPPLNAIASGRPQKRRKSHSPHLM
jgi:A/G-specific adenine glycosylase